MRCVAGVVLAAGFSRRLGRPKQEVRFGHETLLQRSLRVAGGADLKPLAAVVRDPQWADVVAALRAQPLLNLDAEQGMATSIRLGVQWARARDAAGVLLMTCDQPALDAHHLIALHANPGRITGSAYAGRVGIPAYFPASAFSDLLRLQGDEGARSLLQGAASVANEDLALDIDTEQDLQKARRLFGESLA